MATGQGLPGRSSFCFLSPRNRVIPVLNEAKLHLGIRKKMYSSWMRFSAIALLAVCFVAVGCDSLSRHSLVGAVVDPGDAPDGRPAQVSLPPEPPKRVTDRKANVDGKILILEYHKLSGKNTELDRTPAKFRADLEKLYKLGYRPVTVSEWLDNKMPLAPGASPVIMTFDDSHDSQLRFKKDGTLAPNCFVSIWKQFAEKHPDFPVHATFFILPPWPFGQVKHIKDKVKMLQDMGSEVASHTYHHLNLTRCDDETVKKEIATSLDWLQSEFGVTNVSLAFPYGNKPRNMSILKGFVYNGKEYHVRCSFLAAGNPAEPITSKKFNPWAIPRVVVCEEEGGSTSWLKVMQKSKKFPPYVAP
jgi:peptidoglycan/xylan/chitin deacetylase (PgdA/CDA1 family)